MVLVLVTVIAVICYGGWVVYQKEKIIDDQPSIVQQSSNNEQKNLNQEIPKEPDSADTLENPSQVASSDGKTYFVYGAPAGQNNKSIKKIIISLPGHGTTADDGYKAWHDHIVGGEYAVAEFNWWRGTGEKTTDYYKPAEIIPQVEMFLSAQGYKDSDTVILHGFSRGSANTYAVIFQDRLKKPYIFDAVISNAGKYQSDFPLADKVPTDSEITKNFTGVPWVLACGGLDPNPDRDGCPGMEETQAFLSEHGANVLGLVTDPSQGHGAFHMSTLKLPAQALSLIEAAL